MGQIQTTFLFALIVGLGIIFKRFIDFRKALRAVHYHVGDRTLLSQFGAVIFLWQRFTQGGVRQWTHKHFDFAYFGADIISSIHALPTVGISFQVADADAIKEITARRARFPKKVKDYWMLTFFGPNIVASEGEEWKRFRKISAPAFSERNSKLVWDESVNIMNGLFDNVWKDKPSISTDHAVDITLPIALFVISTAGFRRRLSWEEDLVVPPGHKMAFKDALHVVAENIFFKIVCPDWIISLGLTERTRLVKLAFDELELYMLEMIYQRRNAEEKEARYDLFSSLLDASEGSDDDAKLTDRELLGNIFVFLLAGHETTAHTLCFTFGLLALYQGEQEKLFQHIKSVIPEGKSPTFGQMQSLTYSIAVFYETMRMFPPIVSIPKIATEDTTLVTTNTMGNKVVVAVPEGAAVFLHVSGLHYNPRYWPDPYEFKPGRFLGDWPRDAFLPFSSGHRSCLGRRFFETEGIAILTMLVSRYKIEVKEEPQFANETFEQRKARVLAAKSGITLTPIRMPLVFKRR